VTWFTNPESALTNLVYAGSQAEPPALDTLQYWRRGRGANLRTGSKLQDGKASPGTCHHFPLYL